MDNIINNVRVQNAICKRENGYIEEADKANFVKNYILKTIQALVYQEEKNACSSLAVKNYNTTREDLNLTI